MRFCALASCAALAAICTLTSPAHAIPFLGSVSASAGAGLLTASGSNNRGTELVSELNGQVDLLGFDAAASWMGLPSGRLSWPRRFFGRKFLSSP